MFTDEARKRGGKNRAKQFTSEYQSWVRSHRTPESLSESGKKRHQKAGASALEALVRHRLENPSNLERQMIEILEWVITKNYSMPQMYDREVIIDVGDRFAIVDFLFPSNECLGKIIEVDGKIWHSQSFSVTQQDLEDQKLRDEKLVELGYQVLRIGEDELLNNEYNIRIKITNYLG